MPIPVTITVEVKTALTPFPIDAHSQVIIIVRIEALQSGGRPGHLPLRAGCDDDRRIIRDLGDWLYDIGLPGKSGIGGGIVTVSPGKGGLGTFAPPLDKAGTSV